jgi:hypothetical protein
VDLQEKCNDFLELVDKCSMNVPSYVQDQLPDFPTGLKKFRLEVVQKLDKLETGWTTHEALIMEVWHKIHEDVFEPITKMVEIEADLTLAEEEGNMKAKQKLENDLCKAIEECYNIIFEPKKGETPQPWHELIGPLSEGCVFYQTKSAPDDINQARYTIMSFVELRRYIADIPTERLHETFKENEKLCRLLQKFKNAVFDSSAALDHTDLLPPILNFKSDRWMTKEALAEEVEDIHAQACKIKDLMPEPGEEPPTPPPPTDPGKFMASAKEAEEAAHRMCRDLNGGHKMETKVKEWVDFGVPRGPLYQDEVIKVCAKCGYIEL